MHEIQQENEDKKIKATVDAILDWKPGTTVESLGPLKGRFARPPPQGCETIADQPIVGAIIWRILTILCDGSLSLCSEQAVPSGGNESRGRRIDFVVDVYKEFLKVLFPEMFMPFAWTRIEERAENKSLGIWRNKFTVLLLSPVSGRWTLHGELLVPWRQSKFFRWN